MSRPPVVITGTGLVTSLGLSADQTWQNLLAGKSGWSGMPALETPAPDGKGGYQAVELPPGYADGLPREVRYLRWAIDQALTGAGIDGRLPYDARRCGIALGTTLHGMRSGGAFLRTGDFGFLRSFLAGNVLQQAAAHLDFGGDAFTTCSACSSSLGSVALACTLLETGQLDLVIAGGYDAVSEYAWAGFNSLRLVSDGPVRPFAKDRRGMKLGEGYAIVVLERAADAARRGAKIVATVAGWGESADAHHLTQPHPRGEGAATAMTAAIDRAGITAADIDLIAAHATGTPDNDAGEAAAIGTVFSGPTPVVGLKSHLGHTLGAAGAAELILAAAAIRDGIIPATAGVAAGDIEFPGLALATKNSASGDLRYSLNTSLGFGGANTCVVLGRAPAPVEEPGPSEYLRTGLRRVCIVGIGPILPESFDGRDTGPIPEDRYLHLLNARRVRRMSEYVKLSLAATTLAVRDAGFADAVPSDTAVVIGTTHGSAAYCVDYYRRIVESGMTAANPMLFAEGVPNAAAAHLSLMLGLKAACQTVIGSRTAGIDAVRLAALRIASGQWDRAIVGAAEEYLPLINDAYRHAGLYGDGGFATGSGAVSLVLESEDSARARGARILGTIAGGASARIRGSARDAVRSVLDRLGPADRVYSSANGTWIDRAERVTPETVSSAKLRPELFSVGPLASLPDGLAAGVSPFVLLASGYDGVVSAVRVEQD
jgi:3-oxoacyl-[acyl-carrier-protein] synthase II